MTEENTFNEESPFAPDPSDDLTGMTMGDLQVLRRLGRGGMADVYVATQQSLGRQVAVKVLRKNLAKDAAYVERFRREARAAAKLTHPNIVQVYDVGNSSGLYYISQEFVDGLNLRECVDRDGPLTLETALNVMVGVGAALDAASGQGITHRDIKPENIMLSEKGEVKVADFGLARVATTDFQAELTQVGLTLGTPLYMSPEQVQGKSVDVRSDLYSLGVTMFHVLTGRPPFEGDTPLSIAVQHMQKDPPSVRDSGVADHVPEWLDEVIKRLMAKEQAKRFDTPAALLEYLQKKLSGSDSSPKLGSFPIRFEATRELQSVMSAEPRSKSKALVWVAAALIPIAAMFAGIEFSKQSAPEPISKLLTAESSVEPQETVGMQFFEAIRINTPAAWESVWQTFPAGDSSENAIYAAKARIQLARLYDEQGIPRSVQQTAGDVVNDPDLPPHLTVIALAFMEKALRDLNRNDEAADIGESLRAKLETLSAENRNLVRTAAPREVLDRLES